MRRPASGETGPRRQRLKLHFQLDTENIRQLQARDFPRGLIIVLWDGANPHRGKLVRELCARTPRLRLQRLANGQAHDLPELMVAVIEFLETIRANRRNLRDCMTHSACSDHELRARAFPARLGRRIARCRPL